MRNGIVYSMLVVFLAAMFLTATGCRRHADRWRSPEHTAEMRSYLARALELNDEQKKELDAIMTPLVEKKEDGVGRQELLEAFLSEARKDRIDAEKLNAMIDGEVRKAQEMMKGFVSSFAAFHQTLSPGQREKLVSLIQEYRGKGRGHNRRR